VNSKASRVRTRPLPPNRWQKGGRGSRGQGRTSLVSTQGPGVSSAQVAAANCFPGCKSGELRVEPACPCLVLAQTRGMGGQVGGGSTPAQTLIGKESLRRGFQQES
jgi:hypothetical protein